MVLCTSSLIAHPSVTLSPAKIPTSNTLILLTPCRNLRLQWSLPASLTTSLRPIPRNAFAFTLRSSLTQKYVYPDPIPEFAESETEKFRAELLKKLSEDKDQFGDELDAVIDVCAQIFKEFLHKEYGGPGTLLVEPFTDMLVALKQKKLPGAPLAARTSLLWAQNYVDEDWQVWNSKQLK
ncbi:hypothetical protein L6164_027208 [Bauhinia variegata]|uniref:Uncharacterized protein n=1 Tax=Bauhinia variegata TaxID=167791 RepID=A0ACB9LTZ3_BAUVA|nr:hypothetical protein L6164_027208 [Bauhinia variegata]